MTLFADRDTDFQVSSEAEACVPSVCGGTGWLLRRVVRTVVWVLGKKEMLASQSHCEKKMCQELCSGRRFPYILIDNT